MIKPSSGGFDMHKWADSKKIIKGLEQELERYKDCVEEIRYEIDHFPDSGMFNAIDKIIHKCDRRKEFEEAKE